MPAIQKNITVGYYRVGLNFGVMAGGQVPFVGTLPRISQWLTAGQNTRA